jgi:glycerophosphoryl diester phosphodiesterase
VHDRRVDRTSTGRGVVSTLSLERLSELDYSSWYVEDPSHADDLVRRHRTASGREPGGVLTLDTLLGLVREAKPGTKLFVETKHPVRYAGLVEAKLVALLSRYGLATPPSKEDSPVVVMSFSVNAMRRIRRLAPALPTVLLFGPYALKRFDGALPRYADYAGPTIEVLRLDPGYVARAAEHGHHTYCSTVDESEDILLCQRLGVRYLATNAPATTRAVLEGTSGGTVAVDLS